jgi:large subunit ribosomal protein L10
MRKEKQYLLDELKEQLNKFSSFVLINYSNINANKISAFRRDVRKMKGGVEFVKKRILVKAAGSLGHELDLKTLPGHIGVVLGDKDALELTKFVFQFRKENDKKVNVVGGFLEGVILSGEQVEELSKLPSKDEMRAQLLATFEAPMSQTLSVMEALITSVVYCLDNKVKQSEGNS